MVSPRIQPRKKMYIAEQCLFLILGRFIREASHCRVEQFPRRPPQLRFEGFVAELGHYGAAFERRFVDGDLVDGGLGVGEGGVVF